MLNGITEPKLAMTDNNTSVIVKTINGPEGSLVLFNEYFCYRLATRLNIPMPASGVCLIDQDTVIHNNCVTPEQYGYGFYSTYLKAATLVETIIPLMKNKEDFFKLLLFDHVIFNTDRNPGNKNDITLKVIDHSHVFINQAIWDANCLKRGIAEKDYLSTRVLTDNNYLYSMFFHNMSITEECFKELKVDFQSKITKDVLCSTISDIPVEWRPLSHDIDALIEYILYRVEHLDNILSTIMNYLKK